MDVRLTRHITPEVRQPPGHRDTKPRWGRRIPLLEVDEPFLEIASCRAEIVRGHSPRDDGMMKWGNDDLHTVVLHDGDAVEHMLLWEQAAPWPLDSRGRRDPVDELVETDRAKAARSRRGKSLPTCQAHYDFGRTRTRPASIRFMFRTTRAYVYGGATCSLIAYSEPARRHARSTCHWSAPWF